MSAFLHPSLPQLMTKEQLAVWIDTNADSKFDHTEKIELSKDDIKLLEHKSSVASRQIDTLKDVEKLFKQLLKKGTPVKLPEKPGDEPQMLPADVTIPPTAGLDILNANRQFADQQIRDGHRIEITTFYFIPYPEEFLMVAVDIEGNTAAIFTRDMDGEEKAKFDRPLLKEVKKGSRNKVDAKELDL